MEKVLITGGSGLIGKFLSTELNKRGYETRILSRREGSNTAKWDIEKSYISPEAFDNVSHIIHLAGENIAEKRWSKKRKKSILESRTKSAELILTELIKRNIRLKSFISASAIGYYGAITSDSVFDESSPVGEDFLAEVCSQWEKAANSFSQVAAKVCIIRTGLVLSSDGGLLRRLLTTAKMGVSVAFGSGKQYMPWIHIQDLCNIYIKALEDNKIIGEYNAVSPNPLKNYEFSQILGKVLKQRQIILKIPTWFISIIFGELGKVLTTGSKVSSTKIIQSGYEFQFPTLTSALEDLI